jgi:hypothetical protein
LSNSLLIAEGDELDEVHETVRQKLAALKGVRVVESAAPSDDSRWDTYDDDEHDDVSSPSRIPAISSHTRIAAISWHSEILSTGSNGHLEEQDMPMASG